MSVQGAVRAGRSARVAAAGCVVTALVAAAGCSTTIDGNGSRAGTSASSSPDFPGNPTAAAPPASQSPSTDPTISAGPTTGAPSGPALSERERQLDAQTNGQAHVVVGVPGGYEAASYDQAGNIDFWANPDVSATWRQLGRSSYPVQAQLGPPHASVQGALLRRMKNATFIVRGVFTGDSSGNAVAFTAGGAGWGAVKAERNGNIGPSGRPVGADQIGLSYDFGFDRGALVTKDCRTDVPIAECGKHPVTKRWLWAGRDFRLA
jgi:hypothetical protein